MPNPRPSAWALISVLVATLLFSPASVLVASAAPPSRTMCQQEFKDFVWGNDEKPPPHVFVLRKSGPNAGHVEKVDFWTYVGVVLRTEYSGSGLRGPIWQRIGALTVKQYAWYYVNQWRGGKVAFTVDNGDGTTTTTYECYHVKDTTADQLYKPEKWDANLEAWVPRNQPTAANFTGMRETWHLSLRKWKSTTRVNKTYMFLSGYRSGTSVPCGADKTGFRIYQASLRDCGEGAKNLTFEEAVRRYLEPVYLVNTRDHDVLADGENYRGDFGLLVPGSGGGTGARVFAGSSTDKFGAMSTKSFSINWSAILGQGTGNVHVPRNDADGGAGDPRMLADLLVLTAEKLWLAQATGNSAPYANPTSTNVSRATGLVVDDFNGDLLADAGLLGPSGLRVMRSQGDGTFGSAADWFSGDLTTAVRSFVGTGDFNGDGKADLVVRNAADGSYQTALSRATCSDFSTKGLCPAAATGAPGLRDLASAGLTTPWAVNDVKHVVGDFDRDGRDDLMAVVKNGANITVRAMRSLGDGTFAGPQDMGSFNFAFADYTPVAMDITPDGMADIALVSASSIAWLRTNERTFSPASMTAMPARALTGGASLTGSGFRPY